MIPEAPRHSCGASCVPHQDPSYSLSHSPTRRCPKPPAPVGHSRHEPHASANGAFSSPCRSHPEALCPCLACRASSSSGPGISCRSLLHPPLSIAPLPCWHLRPPCLPLLRRHGSETLQGGPVRAQKTPAGPQSVSVCSRTGAQGKSCVSPRPLSSATTPSRTWKRLKNC